MKFLAFTIIILLSIISIKAQIPNSGFENWTTGEPDEWLTNNILSTDPYVTQTNDSNSGASAVKLEVKLLNGFPFGGSISAANGLGFPVSQRYPALNGNYKFMPNVNTTELIIYVDLFNGNIPVGTGALATINPSGSYHQFSIPINYLNTDIPDVAYLTVSIVETEGSTSSVGGYAIVDDLTFGSVTSIDNNEFLPVEPRLEQNYPNPFNPTTVIKFSIQQESFVELKVFDALGNEVAILANNYYTAGNYQTIFRGDNLPSGIYIARLTAGEFNQTKKMLLLK